MSLLALREQVSDSRAGFLERVAATFEPAGVEYVVLHGGDPGAVDSDVDVAVTRRSLATVDALVRSGALGRPLQSLHYDVPWSYWYVLETGDPRRPYRQLDVTCDPWGAGRYGRSVAVALARPARIDVSGARLADPAAEVLYLAVKRARKGLARPQDALELRRVYASCSARAKELLAATYGEAGAAVAGALENGDETMLAAALARLARSVTAAQIRSGARLVRLGLSLPRIGHRLLRPAGLVVCLAGPDGAGKSTLAAALEDASGGLFRRYRRLHLGPGLLPPPRSLLRRAPTDTTRPHAAALSGRTGSLARVAYLWLDAALGWLPRVTAPRIRSGLVVIERGWRDLEVDPRRYRIGSSPALTRALGRLLPRPDVMLVLDAPAGTIGRRSRELPPAEIERQRAAWQAFAAASPGRVVTLDATRDQGGVLASAEAAIRDVLAERGRELVSFRPALAVLGGLDVSGAPYTLLRAGRHGCWALPGGRRTGGPLSRGLYRPATPRHLAGALALEVSRYTGSGRTTVRVATGRGLGLLLAEMLGVREVEIAVAANLDPGRAGRLLVAVRHRGAELAFAKLLPEDDAGALEHESRVLEALAPIEGGALQVPQVVGLVGWEGYRTLLLRPVPTRGRADRALGDLEVRALACLSQLGPQLAGVLGERPGLIPVHGDFAPWNSGTASGRLALWDWEWARLGLPFEDLFHWRSQRLALFGAGTPEGLVRGAFEPDRELRSLAATTGADLSEAPLALRAALEHALRRGEPADTGASAVRRQVLELIDRRLA